MRGRTSQHGFTLVELLVVLVVIAILAALILPAVQRAREAGRRANCINNQRSLAQALLQYEQANSAFPGYNNVQADFVQGGSRIITVTGWVFPLLPLLERSDLHALYGGESEAPTRGMRPRQSLKIMACPSDVLAHQRVTPDARDANSYVVNCGLADQTTDPLVPGDWPTNGVLHSAVGHPASSFVDAHDVDGIPPVEVTIASPYSVQAVTSVNLSMITRADGLSTTLLLSENVDSGGWTSPSEAAVGFVWQASAVGNEVRPVALSEATHPDLVIHGRLRRINEEAGLSDPSSPVYEFARPSSFHPGGVVMTFCDGHVRFVDESIDYPVYCHLMTPHGKFTASPGNANEQFRKDDFPTTPGILEGRSAYALTHLGSDSY